jgi:hypothetical protein
MRDEVKDDLSNSTTDFGRVVAPVIERWCDASSVSVEAVTDNEMADELDQTAGVDSWNVKTGDIIRGVASRVQYVSSIPFDSPPDTFTVRKERPSGAKTEYDKRLDAIQNDGLYPHWQTQAYLDQPGGDLLSLARIKTKALIRHIKNGDDGDDYYVMDPEGEASFFCVKWWRLNELGLGVRMTKPYKKDKSTKAKADNRQVGLSAFSGSGGDD